MKGPVDWSLPTRQNLVHPLHKGRKDCKREHQQRIEKARSNDLRESKNGEGRFLPISGELRRTLQSVSSRFCGEYVFPSYLRGRKQNGSNAVGQHPYTDLKNSFSVALKRAGISVFAFTTCGTPLLAG